MTRTIGTRTAIVDSANHLEIHIRSPRAPGLLRWGPLLFLPVWIAFWTYAGARTIQETVQGPTVSSIVWLLGWLLGELFALFSLGWLGFGNEVIAASQGMLRVSWGIGNLLRSRVYPLRECFNIRAAGWFGEPSFGVLLLAWNRVGGTVAFDCSGKTVRFGLGLDEREAEAVSQALEPFIRPKAA